MPYFRLVTHVLTQNFFLYFTFLFHSLLVSQFCALFSSCYPCTNPIFLLFLGSCPMYFLFPTSFPLFSHVPTQSSSCLPRPFAIFISTTNVHTQFTYFPSTSFPIFLMSLTVLPKFPLLSNTSCPISTSHYSGICTTDQ